MAKSRQVQQSELKDLHLKGGTSVQSCRDAFNERENEYITCSFQTLAKFYNDNEKLLASALGDGTLELVDYAPSDVIKLTSDEKKELRKKKPNLKPPKPGYTLVEDEWHRSGAVILVDKKREQCYLLGQDEGTYFGVELPTIVTSLDQGFKALMPEYVAKHPQGVVRQGEWFMVPVDKDKVPSRLDAVLLFDEDDGLDSNIVLPREDDGKRHVVSSSDGRVAKDGSVYALAPTMRHDDHRSIAGEHNQWYTFMRNTAKRSYSVEGVD